MLSFRNRTAAGAILIAAAGLAAAQENAVNPLVQKVVSEVSESRIEATLTKLVSFGTRNTMSDQNDPEHGIGAARRWIFDEFKSYSPRLQVRFDTWTVRKRLPRIFRDVDLYNVVAVLPGKQMPETQIIISAHYDSLNLGTSQAGASVPGEAVGERPVQSNWEENSKLPAPGACDDGSGVAAVMELARVMSRYEFDKTLVFVAFAGEEQGLVGATLAAGKATKEARTIEAVLNNDIIGNIAGGDGRIDNASISVYGGEIMDSPSQELARFARTIGERYVPSMKVNPIFLEDRLGRGGDQIPFREEGFGAVRFSSPVENFTHEHSVTDTLANMSIPYTARAAMINAAVAATLALAPKTPQVLGAPQPVTNAPPGASRTRRAPMISRGRSEYDAQLRWRNSGPDTGIKGFAVVVRSTLSPYWEREIFVGKVNEYTLTGVSIDDVRFGVKAIGEDGVESLIAPYTYPPRQKVEYETGR